MSKNIQFTNEELGNYEAHKGKMHGALLCKMLLEQREETMRIAKNYDEMIAERNAALRLYSELRDAAWAMVKHMKDRHELSTCCHDVTPTPAYVLERALCCTEQTHPSGEPCMTPLPCKYHTSEKRECRHQNVPLLDPGQGTVCPDCGKGVGRPEQLRG